MRDDRWHHLGDQSHLLGDLSLMIGSDPIKNGHVPEMIDIPMVMSSGNPTEEVEVGVDPTHVTVTSLDPMTITEDRTTALIIDQGIVLQAGHTSAGRKIGSGRLLTVADGHDRRTTGT